MLGVVRFALEVLLFFLLLGALMGVISDQTDTGWRIAAIVIGVLCLVAIPFVRRIGREDDGRPHGGAAAR
jgi:hypothetical protein